MAVGERQRPAQRRERRQTDYRAQLVAVQERRDAHARRWRCACAAGDRLAHVDVDEGLAAQIDVAYRGRPGGELWLRAQPRERLLRVAGEAPGEAQQRLRGEAVPDEVGVPQLKTAAGSVPDEGVAVAAAPVDVRIDVVRGGPGIKGR